MVELETAVKQSPVQEKCGLRAMTSYSLTLNWSVNDAAADMDNYLFPANRHQHLPLGNHHVVQLICPVAGDRLLLHRRHGGEHGRRQMVRLPSSKPPKFCLGKVRKIFLAATSEKAPTEEEEEENCKGTMHK